MKKLLRFWQVTILDILGVLCMIGALLTGWLPGPGGIPLFIIGLSLLAVNHTWAQRYVKLLREYADRADAIMFPPHPWIRAAYDVITPLLIAAGVTLVTRHSAVWTTSLGLSSFCLGLVVFFCNRERWNWLKARWRSRNHSR